MPGLMPPHGKRVSLLAGRLLNYPQLSAPNSPMGVLDLPCLNLN